MSDRSDVVELLDRCAASLHPEHVRPLLGSVIDEATAGTVATTFAMLADPTRARIVHALSLADELCVCDLALLLGVSQSAMSHQLRLLRDHRMVARRRAGRIAYYRLDDSHIRHIFADGTRHALERRAGAAAGAAAGPGGAAAGPGAAATAGPAGVGGGSAAEPPGEATGA